jgi:hypothetical protein
MSGGTVITLHVAGAQYTMPVTGCTDNSILTLEPFIAMNEGQFQWEAEDGACISVDPDVGWAMPSSPTALATTSIPPLLTMYLNSTSFRTYDDLFAESLASSGKVLLLFPSGSFNVYLK